MNVGKTVQAGNATGFMLETKSAGHSAFGIDDWVEKMREGDDQSHFSLFKFMVCNLGAMILRLANPVRCMDLGPNVQIHVGRMRGGRVRGHIDKEDGMPQLIMTLGEFTGGSLWVIDEEREVNTLCRPTVVEGRRKHGVKTVEGGVRWVMIAHGSKHLFNRNQHKKLDQPGFKSPANDPAAD